MSFESDSERIEKLELQVRDLKESQVKLNNVILNLLPCLAKALAAQQRLNIKLAESVIKILPLESEAERQALLSSMAAAQKEVDARELEIILQTLLPPIPPGLADGSAPGS